MVNPSKPDVFQAISDPTRRSLLKLLAEKELSITDIVEFYPISRTAINKHLHILFNAGLVKRQKVGRETRYMLDSEPLIELKGWLSFFERYWDKNLLALKEYVEKNND
ncbi:transcriptional regulator [Sporosarcina sp. P21c]|uniref:ArsR/SmtB family transcription factor n=1 Tax=unclassified Sporosarcina TaxID=2647733 RepID=UPI000C165D22|nr:MULTISPECIES: metalloregulator ArsR/SmtB family transcription factor [unclassified Sporosarcina]PIC67108.1 transcriptional regulator [Sporosarcina sp. P16a]PIC82772.1 transcriptional regulator [Sporosarcina sp. P1]PIC89599.1 transcriptional regulator [Sporosarcina sp. P21c]PIC92560.1 transcriptional regulator [Sporosarcina sp. P25]